MSLVGIVEKHGQKSGTAIAAAGVLVAKYGFGVQLTDTHAAVLFLGIMSAIATVQRWVERRQARGEASP